MRAGWRAVAAGLVLGLAGTACGGGGSGAGGADDAGDRPVVVVSTSILGDVVGQIVGDAGEVVTIMPPGTSPHLFQPSARDVDRIRRADALVLNGAGLEAGILDVTEADSAVPTFEAVTAVDTLPIEGDGHDHGDEHDGGEGDDDAEAGQEAVDPHFFTDPVRMAEAAEAIAAFLVDAVPALDPAAVTARAAAYAEQLRALDTEVESILAPVPAERRVLVTNHEVFGYFADRYGFEVVGTVIPGGSTGDAVSAGALTALAQEIRAHEVPALFTDTETGGDLARTVAAEVGGVEVVELFTESLGGPGSGAETYAELVRTNAQRIAAALGGRSPDGGEAAGRPAGGP